MVFWCGGMHGNHGNRYDGDGVRGGGDGGGGGDVKRLPYIFNTPTFRI